MFLVSYSHLIPISLYVAIEMLKYIQSLRIVSKLKQEEQANLSRLLASLKRRPKNIPKFDDSAITISNTEVIENLGQINMLLTDKTGTLTKQQMSVKLLFINGQEFGDYPPVGQNGIPKSSSESCSDIWLEKRVVS